MTIKIAAILLALSVWLHAQETSHRPDEQTKITKVIRVRGDAERLGMLAKTPGGASVTVNNTLHAIVASGSPASVAEVEQIIHELENGSSDEKKDVELTFYLLSGSSEAQTPTTDPENAALLPVYRQLHAIFPLKSYRLVNTMLLRSSDSSGSAPQIRGMLRSLNGVGPSGSYQPSTYRIVCIASADPSSVIHITRLSFEAQIPVSTTMLNSTPSNGSTPSVTSAQQQIMTLGVDTKLDLHEGQKVVVGTSNIEPGEITLFLVVSAHILP
jgi:hypothetical protein